ncbi:MAG: amidohydrolase family protein [Dehalococcoidia bacterium]|nr:amidohydrolase family protein [Dehalococcoidia bacterium]
MLAQAFNSPDLMRCLSGRLGLQALMQLTSRVPTEVESTLIMSCTDDNGEAGGEVGEDSSKDTFISAEWQERIDAAFAPAACESTSPGDYPASYYGGPLIDTHLHIPQLPDDGFGAEDDGDEESGGVDSELYDSIAEDDRPLLGRTVTISDIACTLQSEGSIRAFAFFPVFEDIPVQLVEVAGRTMLEYPSLFVPFIQSSGSDASTVEADILQEWLEINPGLFFGHGEVGDSPTESINPHPDSKLYTENVEVDRANGLPVYYHTGEGHHENMARALERFPDITFIVHSDFIRPHIDGLMDDYPNIYFTFNDIFDEITPQFRFGDKEDFISAMRADWDQLLDDADDMYRPMIEDHPDRYMWGTDRADIVWNYDEDIGLLLAEFGRAFIGRFDPAIQEMLAYKNAEELIANNQR